MARSLHAWSSPQVIFTLNSLGVALPFSLTVGRAGPLNFAETETGSLTRGGGIEQAAVPEQAPPQPAKVEPGPGTALSSTGVPNGMAVSQTDPQSMPAGVEVTVPVPLPSFVTVTVKSVSPAALPSSGHRTSAQRATAQTSPPARTTEKASLKLFPECDT